MLLFYVKFWPDLKMIDFKKKEIKREKGICAYGYNYKFLP
jgi:hypothetical protein